MSNKIDGEPRFRDKLNDKNLFNEYGLVIQTGTEMLLEYPERKEILSNDWRDENGISYDLEVPRFKDKEVRLYCAIIAVNDIKFWEYYDKFFTEITQPGWQSLYIEDHTKTYKVFYKKSSSFKKLQKRLKDVEKVFVKFQIQLIASKIEN